MKILVLDIFSIEIGDWFLLYKVEVWIVNA